MRTLWYAGSSSGPVLRERDGEFPQIREVRGNIELAGSGTVKGY